MPGTATPPNGALGALGCVTGACGWPRNTAGRPTSSPCWNVLGAGLRIVSGGAAPITTISAAVGAGRSSSWRSSTACGNGGACGTCWNARGGGAEDAEEDAEADADGAGLADPSPFSENLANSRLLRHDRHPAIMHRQMHVGEGRQGRQQRGRKAEDE